MRQRKKGTRITLSGPLGNVIGSSWKGIDYMRSKPKRQKKRKSSQKQLEQQGKFSVAILFARTICDLLTKTFDGYANQMSGVNKAVSDIILRAVSGTYPAYSIEYSEVFISRGSLPNAHTAVASADIPGTIGFSWTNREKMIGNARPTDQVLLVAYCPECKRAVYRKGALRSALADTLSVGGFKHKVVQTWLTFLSADGKYVADSIYTGEIMVGG